MKKVAAPLIVVAVILLALGGAAEAQQPKKIPRIGFIGAQARSSSQSQVEGFRQGLRERGYVEEKNIVVDYRYGEGRQDLLRDFAGDLVRLKVDIIVTASTVAALAAKKLTGTIPIVMAGSGDPVGTGLVASLARPGGNVTGLSAVSADLITKQLELAREIIPKLARAAVLYDPRNPVNKSALKEIEVAAASFRIQLVALEVQGPEDYETAFATAAGKHTEALLVRRDPINQTSQNRIVSLAERNRLPAIYPSRQYVEIGGLMSYGVVSPDLYRRAAHFVDKILKGAKPAELPVEQPTKFEFAINLKTAQQLGLTIPQWTLIKADRVIK